MKKLGLLAVWVVPLAWAAQPSASGTYQVDPVHSSVVFRVHHAGAAYFWGRFNEVSGTFTLDPADPTKCSFTGEIQAGSVDTNNEKRDAHLKSPDFLNAKQYPTITFQSTSVKKGSGNVLEVTGNLQLHGVTKEVTVPIELTGAGEFPPGTQRAGIEAVFEVKMSDFEIKSMPGALSDEVRIIVAFEGVKQ